LIVPRPSFFREVARLGKRKKATLLERFGLARPGRALNQFATHVPILIGIARLLPIRRVLELGSGTYSTLTFLNEAAFPHLFQLDSFETDQSWAERLAAATSAEPRIRIKLVDEPIEESVRTLELSQYDLILVDHAVNYETRAQTIQWLTKMPFGSALIVIHDFEISQYRYASRGFPHKFEFSAFTPATAVAWHDLPLDRPSLRFLSRAVSRLASILLPEDVASWSAELDAEFEQTRITIH
jgi:predicted O-methyltransferase YrrM